MDINEKTQALINTAKECDLTELYFPAHSEFGMSLMNMIATNFTERSTVHYHNNDMPNNEKWFSIRGIKFILFYN